MTNVTYGEVVWGEVPTDGAAKTDNRDLFMRLEKGSNIVRIVTAPHQYTVHRYKKEGDPGFGQKVNCSAVHGSCPLCALGDKPKRRWLVGIIDRKTRAYKILDMGQAVFKSIQHLTRDEEWGEPVKYDLDIKMDPNGGATGYYTVTPKMPKPLSADDQQLRDMVDADELKRRTTPPEPAKVQERLDRIMNGTPTRGSFQAAPARNQPATARVGAPQPRPAVPQVDTSSDDDDDMVQFPDYSAKM